MKFAFVFLAIIFFGQAAFSEGDHHLSRIGNWIWGNTNYTGLAEGSKLFIHQGTFTKKNGEIFFEHQGLASVQIPKYPLVIVFRLETLPEPIEVATRFANEIYKWEHHNNNVVGVQIDFDSPSKNLKPYINFLNELRANLLPGFELSITGLADWASSASPVQLMEIGRSVDYIVFQLYRGTLPIPNIQNYKKQLESVRSRFLIGILPVQQPQLAMLSPDNDQCWGYIIFGKK